MAHALPRSRPRSPWRGRAGESMIGAMDFTLTEDDAQQLRHIASLDPSDARAYLQDRPELARRVSGWPPEIRLEVCRILWQSFPAEKRASANRRRNPGSNLIDLLSSADD